MKVLLTATVQSHICQFHKPLVSMLHEHGCEVHVAAHNNLAEKNGLKLDFVDRVFDVPFDRSPKSPKNVTAYRMLKKIIDDGHYDVVHCNTPVGGVITRLAAKRARKNGTRVFYTAHGFHFYHGASQKAWLTFFPIEKSMSAYCDKLITITEEDYRLASQRFSVQVEHIHGVGVDANRYHPASNIEQLAMRSAEGLNSEDYVVLCTGELRENKNQKALVQAASLLTDEIPHLKVLLAGNGPCELALQGQIQALGLQKQVKLLGYRTDLENLVPAVDLVATCSYREGLPLNVVEAMLCKKPVIASQNRGHRELVDDGITGCLVQPNDVESLKKKLLALYYNKNLAKSFGEAGYEKALLYTAETVKQELETIYEFNQQ